MYRHVLVSITDFAAIISKLVIIYQHYYEIFFKKNFVKCKIILYFAVLLYNYVL